MERGREKERVVSVKGGRKGQGKKVEKENGERTCNLTVMKGTPRKECNQTKVSMFGGRGLKKKEREKVLSFQPAACERSSVFLPVSQAP